MCLVLYLASDHPRSTSAWDADRPAFHVVADDPGIAAAAGHLTKLHAYYVGSDQGCGCGFMREFDAMYDEPGGAEKAANQRALHDYVVACLRDESAVELFACWSGDEAEPLADDRAVRPADLLDPTFYFAERQRTVVRRNEP